MKIRMMGCVIVLALVLPVTAEARCESGDLRGRWDVYGFLDSPLDLEGTLNCVFVLNKSGRFIDAVCVARSSAGRGGSVNRGRLTIRGNCAVRGEIKNTDSCRLSGTMTRNKDMISGVYNCDLTEVGLMTMVRR
jgi:hypothetical protein